MKDVTEFINRWVLEAEPYSDKHMEFAWAHPDVVRMMSNENPLPPSQKVLDAIERASRLGNLYPDTGPRLKQKLGKMAGLSAENVILGNGSTDVINFVLQTFVAPGEEVVISVPTFPMYETRTRVNGGLPVLVPMGADLYWDMKAILQAVTSKTKLIFICTPNNPTGNVIAANDIRRILDLGVPTFIDEAYYELADEPVTYAPWIREYPHALINRTFSKAYGLAGLRLGYLYADAKVINYLNRVRIPWNVSLIALAAACAALEDVEDQRAKLENNAAGRAYLVEEVNKIPGFRAFQSQGNFVLIDASVLGRPANEIVNSMIERGIFVRPMAGHHLTGFIRVTVGTPETNRRFVEVFKETVAEMVKRS